jgi:hypothetical protein
MEASQVATQCAFPEEIIQFMQIGLIFSETVKDELRKVISH